MVLMSAGLVLFNLADLSVLLNMNKTGMWVWPSGTFRLLYFLFVCSILVACLYISLEYVLPGFGTFFNFIFYVKCYICT